MYTVAVKIVHAGPLKMVYSHSDRLAVLERKVKILRITVSPCGDAAEMLPPDLVEDIMV